jgi:hypothetical protein
MLLRASIAGTFNSQYNMFFADCEKFRLKQSGNEMNCPAKKGFPGLMDIMDQMVLSLTKSQA